MQPKHRESLEHSQNSRIKQVETVEVTVGTEVTKHSAASSDFPEDSQNSLASVERKMDNGEANASFWDCDGRCSVTVSKIPRIFSKLVGGDGIFGRQRKEASH